MDSQLPIRIKKIPGGFRIVFGDELACAYVYATDDHRVTPVQLSWQDAETLAKEIALTLTAAWARRV